MAKKEQDNPETTGKDLTNGMIEIADGVNMDSRLRVEGMLFLEEKFDKPLGQIKFSEGGRVQSLIPLFIALVIQANDGMTEEIAEQHVRKMDANTMLKVANEIPKMLAVPTVAKEDDPENPPKTEPETETSPEPEPEQ